MKNGASLVSGNGYVRLDNHSSREDFTVKMTAGYHGKLYTSQESGQSGLNYKDGDKFSFYIFPSEAHQSNEISLNEKGKVDLTVMMLALFPSMYLSSMGVKELSVTYFAIPIMNLFSLLKELVFNTINVEHILVTILSNLAAMIILFIIGRILFLKDKWVMN